jgi:molybdate transport system ATP-binding protein
MLEVDLEARVGAASVSCHFDVSPGSAVALVGASGAGKTSVLRAIAGLIHPQRGRIASDGETWFDAQQRIWMPPQLRDCGFVFAEYALFGHMSAVENVAFGLRHWILLSLSTSLHLRHD